MFNNVFPRSNDVEIMFNHPSSEWLREKCDLLGIEYCFDAYQVWAQSEVVAFKLTSTPDLLNPPNTEYGCISNLLTGNSESANKICRALNMHFYGNFKSLGWFRSFCALRRTPNFIGTYKKINFTKAKYNDKFIQDLLFADKMSDYHFELLARWLECRIGVFEERQWKRFGRNWEATDSQTITVLLKKEDDEYKIVLSLK